MTNTQLAVTFASLPVRETNVLPSEESPAEAVIETVADLEGVEPTALPPLYTSIEPNMLNKLVTHSHEEATSPMSLCFTYHGWNVFVRGDGTIIVGDPDRPTEPTPLF